MFDISTMGAAETADVDLVHPATGVPMKNDAGEPLSVTVYGPGSERFQEASAVRNRAVLEHVRRGGKKLKDEEQRTLDAEFLATCTRSFNGFSYKGGNDHAAFRAAYLDTSIGYVAEQVNRELADWGNFMTAPAPS